MSRKITNEEFQKAFDLAYILHPRADVALRVTMDACDVLTLLEATQVRRRRSTRHYKTAIPSERLLQFAVFLVSYIRERDQESPRPMMEPKYKPTRDDLVVRYVKHLIWKTTLLSWKYVAVGIGCLLYSYKPSAIADLLLFEANNLGHIKMRIARDLIKRFYHSGVVIAEGRSIRTRPANNDDRMMIQQALNAFAPWQSAHIAPPSPDTLILETLVKENCPMSDWDRKHALIDPQCAGFEHLVNEYNGYFTSIRQTLTDPVESLVVPDFEGAPNPPLQRFNRRLLSESEKMLLSERRKPSGPWAYEQDALYFYFRSLGLTDSLFEEISPTLEDADWDGRYDACIDKLDGRAVDFDISTRTFFPVGTTTVDRRRMMIVEEEFEDPMAPDTLAVALRRTPVVTVMGHVDHGKTSLLDAIGQLLEREHQNGSSGKTLHGPDAGNEGEASTLFDKLAQEFEKHLRQVASGWGDAAEAENVAQELFILVWKAFEQREAGINVRHYLFKMLSHMLRLHHCDNIMRRGDGYVKVIDFGLVKPTERLETTDTEVPTSEMFNTDPALVLETINYLSPDQASGHRLDFRTDMWSLGVVLYEVITDGVTTTIQDASPSVGTGGPEEGPTGLSTRPSEIRSEISCTWKNVSDRAADPWESVEGGARARPIAPCYFERRSSYSRQSEAGARMLRRWLSVWVSKPAKVMPGGSRRSFMIERWRPTDALPLTALVVTPRGLSRTIEIDDTWVMLNRPIGFEPRADLARRRSRQSAVAPPDWYDTLGARRILNSILISQEERDETREQSACRVDPRIERTDWYDSLGARRILDSIFISQEECDETREQSTCRVEPSIELESSYTTVCLKSDLTATIEGSSWATH